MTSTRKFRSVLMAAAGAFLLAGAACGGGTDSGPGDGTDPGTTDPGTGGGDDGTTPPQSEWDKYLAQRKVDYGQALRIAALKLTGELPTLAEIEAIATAGTPEAAKMIYESLIDSYLEDPRFVGEIRDFFRDTFKMGGGDLDTAPNLAAMLVVNEGNFMDLFTAASGNCPTFDPATKQFTAADCASGAPQQAGVLTNPAVMRHFFSNMAFRRVRWVQETFVCTKFPAEVGQPVDVGGAAAYTAPWDFMSLASPAEGGVVDFRDTSSVVCANCHATMNRQAPLFAHFDEDGMWQTGLAVPTPVEGMPTAREIDYLVPGQGYAWRYNVPVTDLASLGAAIAADPDVAECQVARIWNWAFGKGDIVAALALVPPEVISAQIELFKSSGYNLKAVIRSVFTSDDFVKF